MTDSIAQAALPLFQSEDVRSADATKQPAERTTRNGTTAGSGYRCLKDHPLKKVGGALACPICD